MSSKLIMLRDLLMLAICPDEAVLAKFKSAIRPVLLPKKIKNRKCVAARLKESSILFAGLDTHSTPSYKFSKNFKFLYFFPWKIKKQDLRRTPYHGRIECQRWAHQHMIKQQLQLWIQVPDTRMHQFAKMASWSNSFCFGSTQNC